MISFFDGILVIKYEGLQIDNDFVFCYYNFDEIVMGKMMWDYLCFVIVYWYFFVWEGGDFFGGWIFDCLWFGSEMDLVKLKVDIVFDMFSIFGVLYFCFYDVDVCLEGVNFVENEVGLKEIIDYF